MLCCVKIYHGQFPLKYLKHLKILKKSTLWVCFNVHSALGIVTWKRYVHRLGSNQRLMYFYRPPMTLREGNVLSCVCLSYCLGVPAQGPDPSLLPVQPPPAPTLHTGIPLPPGHAQTCSLWSTGCRQAGGGIQLKCLLVVHCKHSSDYIANPRWTVECHILTEQYLKRSDMYCGVKSFIHIRL